MKIAFIFEPEVDFLEKQILALSLVNYINGQTENEVCIDLYTSFSPLINELNNNSVKVIKFRNLKDILKKNYQVIYNFGNHNIFLCSAFFSDFYPNFINIIDENQDNQLNNFFPEVKNVIPINIFFENFCGYNEINNSDYFIVNFPSNLEITDIPFIQNVLNIEKKKYIFYPVTNNMNTFGIKEKFSSNRNIFVLKNTTVSFELLNNAEIFIDFSENVFTGLYCFYKNKNVFSLAGKPISKFISGKNIISNSNNLIPILNEKTNSNTKISSLNKDKINQLNIIKPENYINYTLKQKKLRIVFFVNAPEFDGNTPFIKGLGGTESAVVYISRQLAKEHEVFVFNNCNNRRFYDGVFYDFLENFPDFSDKNQIDILIFVRSHFIFPELKAKVIIFWTEDNFDQPMSKKFITDSYNSFLVDKIFVVSNYQKNVFIKNFNTPEEKFFVTRNGINPEFFSQKKEHNKFKLIYTSTPYRGLNLLINIFLKVKKIIPETELDVYSSMKVHGLDFEEKDFEDLYSKIKSKEGINLCEPVSQPELAKILLGAGLFTYPNTFSETSCISALEAQAAGLPVITSELGALPETVKNNETGICIPGNPESEDFLENFTQTIISFILDDKKRIEFCKNAQKRMFEEFSWETISKEWIIEFQSLISEYEILKKFYRTTDKILRNSNNKLNDQILEIYFGLSENFSSAKLLFWENEFLEKLFINLNISFENKEKISLRHRNINKYL